MSVLIWVALPDTLTSTSGTRPNRSPLKWFRLCTPLIPHGICAHPVWLHSPVCFTVRSLTSRLSSDYVLFEGFRALPFLSTRDINLVASLLDVLILFVEGAGFEPAMMVDLKQQRFPRWDWYLCLRPLGQPSFSMSILIFILIENLRTSQRAG